MEKATYDNSSWPILLVTQKQPMTTAEYRLHLNTLSSFFGHGRFGIVLDVRGCGSLSADERRLAAEFFDVNVARHPGGLVCFSLVMSSSVQRGIFKAISWLTTASFEREAFKDLESARKWTHACLRAPMIARLAAR